MCDMLGSPDDHLKRFPIPDASRFAPIVVMLRDFGGAIVSLSPTARAIWRFMYARDQEIIVDNTGLSWVAICLHLDSIMELVGLTGNTIRTFFAPVMIWNIIFLAAVENFLKPVQRKLYSQDRGGRKVWSYATAIVLSNFSNIAKRNYGTLPQIFQKALGGTDWCFDMCKHANAFAQFHLNKLIKEIGAFRSREDWKEWEAVCGLSEYACEKIAQINLRCC